MMEAIDRLTRARVQLENHNPFFAYLVLHLNLINKPEIISCGVDDASNLYYNEKFIKGLSDEQIEGVLCHEVLHLAFQHLLRKGTRDMMIYNIASDLVTNDILLTNNFQIPKESLRPENHTFTINKKKIKDLNKKVAEEVYDEIYNSLSKNQKLTLELMNKVFDKHIFGKKGLNGSGRTPEELKKEQEKWKKRLAEAGAYAKKKGNIPAGMDRLIEKVLVEKLNWKALLYKYITREIPHDYTYSRPHKKSIVTGFYMPDIVRETIDVTIAIDTSGSIGQEELTEFISEILNLAKSFPSIKMTMIVADCKIQDVYEVSNGSMDTIQNLKIRGGGGTDFEPAVKWILKNKPMTKLLIYFTDGYGDLKTTNLPFRTLWVLTKDYNDSIPKSLNNSEIIYL